MKEIIDEYADVKTELFNSRLYDCVRSGFKHHDATFGLFAADPYCYNTFAKIFNPIIVDFHGLTEDFIHPPTNWGEPNNLSIPDADGDFIQKCQINCSRSIECYPFYPKMSLQDFDGVLKTIEETLYEFIPTEFNGQLYSFGELDESMKLSFSKENFMFDCENEYFKSSGAARWWPRRQALYISEDRKFVMQINNRDHLRVGYEENSADMKKAYEMLSKSVKILDKRLATVKHSVFGHLTSSPKLLGNAMEMAVQIRLDKLPRNSQHFEQLLHENKLIKSNETRGLNNEILIELRSKCCLNKTEYEMMAEFCLGIANLISIEKSLK